VTAAGYLVAAAEVRTYTAANLTDLASIDRQTLHEGLEIGVWVNAENAPRLFNRYGAEFLDGHEGVRLFLRPDLGPMVYESPPDFAVGISDAVLTGYRMFLIGDGRREKASIRKRRNGTLSTSIGGSS
jgi:hypothetical protein